MTNSLAELRARTVHPRQLDVPRCSDPLRARSTPARNRTGASTRHVRRLDPGNLLSSRHARRQPDRQGPGSWGGRVRRFEGGLEGQTLFVHQLCVDGGWSRWERCECFSLNFSNLPPRVRCIRLPRGSSSLVRLDPQVHLEQLPRDVQVLRLLQRLAERRVDALCGCALDIPE